MLYCKQQVLGSKGLERRLHMRTNTWKLLIWQCVLFSLEPRPPLNPPFLFGGGSAWAWDYDCTVLSMMAKTASMSAAKIHFFVSSRQPQESQFFKHRVKHCTTPSISHWRVVQYMYTCCSCQYNYACAQTITVSMTQRKYAKSWGWRSEAVDDRRQGSDHSMKRLQYYKSSVLWSRKMKTSFVCACALLCLWVGLAVAQPATLIPPITNICGLQGYDLNTLQQ